MNKSSLRASQVLATLLLFFSSISFAGAQFPDPEPSAMNMFKNKIILVSLAEEVTNTLFELKSDPQATAQYKAGLARYNEMLKRVVPANLKQGKGYEFLPVTKVNALLKEGNAKYLYVDFVQRDGTRPSDKDIAKYYDDTLAYDDALRGESVLKGFGAINFSVVVTGKPSQIIYSIFTPASLPSEMDWAYALRLATTQINRYAKVRTYQVGDFNLEREANVKYLVKRTLLVEPSQLKKTTAAELSQALKIPVMLVDRNRIAQAVLSGDSAYAYLVSVPLEAGKGSATEGRAVPKVLLLLVDAGQAGRVLGRVRATRLNVDRMSLDLTKSEAEQMTVDYVEPLPPAPKPKPGTKPAPKPAQKPAPKKK